MEMMRDKVNGEGGPVVTGVRFQLARKRGQEKQDEPKSVEQVFVCCLDYTPKKYAQWIRRKLLVSSLAWLLLTCLSHY